MGLSARPARAANTDTPPPDPYAALPRVRVVGPGITVPIATPAEPLTFSTGDRLPLIQQNEHFFVALVDSPTEGKRMLAFAIVVPEKKSRWKIGGRDEMFSTYLASEQKRCAWVTTDYEMFFAYPTAPATNGFLYLEKGDELPIVEETTSAYKVVIKRHGHEADFWIAKSTPGIEHVHVTAATPRMVKQGARYVPVPEKKEEPPVRQLVIQYPPEAFQEVAKPSAQGEKDGWFAGVRRFFAGLFAKEEEPEKVAETPAEGDEGGEAAEAATPTGVVTTIEQFVGEPEGEAGSLSEKLARYRLFLETALAVVILASTVLALVRRSRDRKTATDRAEARKIEQIAEEQAEEAEVIGDLVLPSADFTGSLGSMSLGSLTQFLNSDKETGILSITDTRNSEIGNMLFVQGEIYDARSPGKRGVDAVYDLLRNREGSFRFTREVVPTTERTIEQGTISLLLDAHRIMDEEETPRPA